MPSPSPGEIDEDIKMEHDEAEWGSYWMPNPEIQEMKEWKPTTVPDRNYFDNDKASQGFANQVRRHIQTMTRSKPLFERKTGKIHNANLYRVAVPNVIGDWNQKIFKKKQDVLDIDTCISILVDWSGSMSNSYKKPTAVRAAQRLVKTFDKALHIPVEVISFSVPWGTNFIHAVIKRFDERVTDVQIAQRFTEFDDLTGGNADAEAVLYTAKRLASRKEKRKILIVLSDGEPTDSVDGSAGYGLKQVTDSIRKRGQIELYGIGIMDDGVKGFYGKNASVIKDVNQLNTELLRILKEGVEHG
jgi:cobalamin biosynthesis protein CobT